MFSKKYRLSYIILPESVDILITVFMWIIILFRCMAQRTRLLSETKGVFLISCVIYYAVIDDNPDDLIMEVRRFLYNGQNRGNIV